MADTELARLGSRGVERARRSWRRLAASLAWGGSQSRNTALLTAWALPSSVARSEVAVEATICAFTLGDLAEAEAAFANVEYGCQQRQRWPRSVGPWGVGHPTG